MKNNSKKEKHYIINIFLIAVILLIVIPSIKSLAESKTIDELKSGPNIGENAFIYFGQYNRIREKK